MQKLEDILRKFPEKKVVVIGDMMIDESTHGHVSKISNEAPTPVVKIDKRVGEVYELGGAANVASNISSLKGYVSIFGFAGKDKYEVIMKNLFEERNITYYLGTNSVTTVKNRVIALPKNQQLIRLDSEDTSKKFFNSELKRKMEQEMNDSDIIVVSDYNKGVITRDLTNFLKKYNSKIIIGPKPENKNMYKGSFLVIPNEEEAFLMAHSKSIQSAGRYLRKKLNSNILITRGPKGMMLFSDKELEIPTYAKDVFDVTGAGDTAIAAVALSLASGSSLEEAAIIANHAAGIAVSKLGTYSVKLSELEKEVAGEEKKIKTFEELKSITSDLKRKGKKIVWTNGCFDILHEGHISYLKNAKELGDYLIVGLNSDESVRKLKGKNRPIRPENARAEIISSLVPVDCVMIFPETSVEKYLSKLKPQIYVKAEDYDLKKMHQNERKAVESYNGKIIFIPIENSISTTKIIEKIKDEK